MSQKTSDALNGQKGQTMIDREEAKDRIYRAETADYHVDKMKIIDEIYDSLGSCKRCKHYMFAGFTPRGEKKSPDMCRLTLTGQPEDHFCADFEEK